MAALRTRQKLAIASWAAPQEGNIYGKMTLDVTAAQAYLDHVRATTGARVTLTHLVGKAIGLALAKAPSLNATIVLGGLKQFETVDLACLVALEDGKDLAKAKVCNVDKKSVVDIAGELSAAAERLRAGKDETFEKSKGPLQVLPTWLIRPLVKLTGFLASGLGINMKGLGLEAYPFGAAVVTSVGMFGIDEAFAPPTPWARVPVWILVGAVREAPVVVDGAIVVRKQLTITATIDHRYIDGAQLGVLARVIRGVFDNPWQLDGLQGPPGQG